MVCVSVCIRACVCACVCVCVCVCVGQYIFPIYKIFAVRPLQMTLVLLLVNLGTVYVIYLSLRLLISIHET